MVVITTQLEPVLSAGDLVFPGITGGAGGVHFERSTFAFEYADGFGLRFEFDVYKQLPGVANFRVTVDVVNNAAETPGGNMSGCVQRKGVGPVFPDGPVRIVAGITPGFQILPHVHGGTLGLHFERDLFAGGRRDLLLGLGLDLQRGIVYRQRRRSAGQSGRTVGHFAAVPVAINIVGSPYSDGFRRDAGVLPVRLDSGVIAGFQILPLDGSGSGRLDLESDVLAIVRLDIFGLGLDGQGGGVSFFVGPVGGRQNLVAVANEDLQPVVRLSVVSDVIQRIAIIECVPIDQFDAFRKVYGRKAITILKCGFANGLHLAGNGDSRERGTFIEGIGTDRSKAFGQAYTQDVGGKSILRPGGAPFVILIHVPGAGDGQLPGIGIICPIKIGTAYTAVGIVFILHAFLGRWRSDIRSGLRLAGAGQRKRRQQHQNGDDPCQIPSCFHVILHPPV